jgi:hypothetical protein
MTERKTIRVRIAVAVDGEGRWSAFGFHEFDDREAYRAAVLYSIHPPHRVTFVEADLQVPVFPVEETVEGKVSP